MVSGAARRAVQRALWREPRPPKATKGTHDHQIGAVETAAEAPVAQSGAVPVAWGEALVGKRLLIQGDASGTAYRWAGQMECGREHRYLLLVVAADEGNPRAQRRVVPVEIVRKAAEGC